MKYLSTLFLLLIMPCLQAKTETQKTVKDYVVILHGIARSSSHMKPLANYLSKQGYDVINLDYPSTDYTIEQLADIVNKELSTKLVENKPVHFVGYSMGGLVVRAILYRHSFKNLGKVVLLATPNHGSEVADFLKNNYLYQKFYGVSGQQLVTSNHLDTLFGDVYYPLGIIAGNSTIDPISSFIIPGEDDGKVSIKSTQLDGMKDHLVVSASHTFFPNYRVVWQQTAYFLKYASFKK